MLKALSIPVILLALLAPLTEARAETLTATLAAGPYRIVDGPDGQRIEMDGFGQLCEPGKPLLPQRRFMLALPPGAVVRGVEVVGLDPTPLPGAYRLAIAEPVRPLTDVDGGVRSAAAMAQWRSNAEALAGSDALYPSRAGVLAGSGGLRKYAYAAVSFRPFAYRPSDGALVHFPTARVTVDYALPAPGSPEAEAVELAAFDTAADDRARRLFTNFDRIRHEYLPASDAAPPKADISDYVIIVPESLVDVVFATGFIDWKESLGHEVLTVMISGAKLGGRDGGDLQESIRNWLRDNYLTRGIEYVLLIGDHPQVPMRYCYPDPDDHSNQAGTPNAWSGEVPTDHYYADLSQPDAASWDLDGDGYYGEWGQDAPDLLADVRVGRIPTSDPTRIAYTLDKLVAYEQDTGAWKRCALHAGAIAFFENQNHMGYEFMDLATCIAQVEDDFMDDWTVSRYSEQGGLVVSPYPWAPLTATVVADDWRTGRYGLVNWGGHGWSNGANGMVWSWDDGDGVPESQDPQEIIFYEFVSLTSQLDDDHPSIVFALSCLVGYPEPNAWGNLGEDILTDPGLGAAVGILSGSRVVWVSQGGGEHFCYEFNHHLIGDPGGPKKLGDAVFDAKWDTYLWNDHTHYAEYWNTYCYNLYGDPAMAREGATPVVAADELPASAGRLAQNVPNPFNPATTIRYELPEPGRVALRIYDLSGRLVRVLKDAEHETAGRHEAIWRGLDDAGRAVPSGTYVCRLSVGGHDEAMRMVLVR